MPAACSTCGGKTVMAYDIKEGKRVAESIVHVEQPEDLHSVTSTGVDRINLPWTHKSPWKKI